MPPRARRGRSRSRSSSRSSGSSNRSRRGLGRWSSGHLARARGQKGPGKSLRFRVSANGLKHHTHTNHRVKNHLRESSLRQTAAKLQDAIAMPDYYIIECGDQIAGAAATNTVGVLPCNYFTANCNYYNTAPGTVKGAPYGHNNPIAMMRIAYLISQGANNLIKFSIKDYYAIHRITNTSAIPTKVVGYLCEARHDIPEITGDLYALDILGNGFYNAASGGGIGAANTGMLLQSNTPYMSNDFTNRFKIVKTKTKSLMGGMTCEYHLKHNSSFMVQSSRYIYMTAGQTFSTGTILLAFAQGEQFWLFKTYADALTNATSTAGQISISAGAVNLRMYTTFHWTYKYVQDYLTQISVSGGTASVVEPATAVTTYMNPVTDSPVAGVPIVS
nr:MAG: capsid protein [Cressdnaviricota sp.]